MKIFLNLFDNHFIFIDINYVSISESSDYLKNTIEEEMRNVESIKNLFHYLCEQTKK